MDKSLLKIAGIISFVLGIICCVTIFGAIVGIPMIIGGNKFKELSEKSDVEVYNQKDTILTWTIVFLFINQLSGILSLIFYLMMESSHNKDTNETYQTNDKYSELEKLKKLYDDKALTKEKYEKEKEKILKK